MKEKDIHNFVDGDEATPPQNGSDAAININADSDVPGTSYLDESLSNESEVQKLQAEIAELKDKYLRQVAEFDNFRKRTAKEKLDLLQTAGKDVIIPLLDVLDDCERAQKQLETTNDVNLIREGVSLVFNKFRNTIQARGVKPMGSLKKDFDPDLHEAITDIPAPSDSLKGEVLDEIQKGYYLNDKIIRFAKVVVGK